MFEPRELSTELLAAAVRLNENGLDVLIYSGDLIPPYDTLLMAEILSQNKNTDVFFVLTTYGGSADVAYRIARCLQRIYDRVHLVVPTTCKSAGSLVALGANELILTAVGELGPLDVQIRKPDTIGERVSGLTPLEALTALRVEAFETFEYFFLEIQERSGGSITIRTAARIAAQMTSGLLRPVYSHLDPMVLGEYQRAMTVANAYGARLAAGNDNVRSGAIGRLLYGYPSHGFVIDREEVSELFETVREPDSDESAVILELMDRGLLTPDGRRRGGSRNQPQGLAPIFGYVAPTPEESEDEAEEHDQEDSSSDPPDASGTEGGSSVAPRSKPKPASVLPRSDRKAEKRAAGKRHEADDGTHPTSE